MHRQRRTTAILIRPPRVPAYHHKLLETAGAMKGSEPEIAVILAQMACEIACELAFTAVIAQKEVSGLQTTVDVLLPNYNLGSDNPRVRKAYVALSGDRITSQPYWDDFKAHVRRRNRIVHGGARATPEEAEKSVTVASSLVAHLEQILEAARA